MRPPWMAPISAPSRIPTLRATIKMTNPLDCGIHWAWVMAIMYAVKPMIDPTERSMLRETMTKTIPVAMIATGTLWTETS
jgi:hypothetical protein